VGQHRQGGALGRRQGSHGFIAGDQGARGSDIEAAVGLETPGVQGDGDVVGQKVVAGEIEVDRPGEGLAPKEDVVGEEVGMDHSGGEIRRPGGVQGVQVGADRPGESGLENLGGHLEGRKDGSPGRLSQGVLPGQGET
jgi:hypothetical protein